MPSYHQYTADEFDELPLDKQEELMLAAELENEEDTRDLSGAAWGEIWAQEHLDRSEIKHGRITANARKQSETAAWFARHERRKQNL